MPNPPEETLTTLTAAVEGLLVPSESDYPLEPFRWDGCGPLTPTALLAALGLPPATVVETLTLDAFFARLTRIADWMDPGERERAGRFAALHDLIAQLLAAPLVYRVGEIAITVLIVGQDAAGATVGLRTTLIET